VGKGVVARRRRREKQNVDPRTSSNKTTTSQRTFTVVIRGRVDATNWCTGRALGSCSRRKPGASTTARTRASGVFIDSRKTSAKNASIPSNPRVSIE